MGKSPEVIHHLELHTALPEWATYPIRVPEARELVGYVRGLHAEIQKRDDHIALMRQQLEGADRRTLDAVDEARRLRNAQGWDPSSPQWAVIRAASDYRKRVNDADAPELHQLCQAIVTAVDGLTTSPTTEA